MTKNKSIGGISIEKLNEIIAQKRFELSAKESSLWLYDSIRLFRAAQVLFFTARDADEKHFQAIVKEMKNSEVSSGDRSRPMTFEESRLNYDSSLITFAYFYLARGIELLLKGILIDRNNDHFIEVKDGKLQFKKAKHNLLQLVNDCAIPLTTEEERQMTLLQEVLFSGTFPIPLKQGDLYKKLNDESNAEFRLDTNHYESVSFLHDKFLAILNSERAQRAIPIRSNIWR